MRLKLPSFVKTRDKSYFPRRTVSLLSISLGLMLCLSAIYSGTSVAKADSVIATIPVGVAPVGIAYDSANGNLYVTNEGDDTVNIISGSTNTLVGNPIRLGDGPFGIAYDSANGNLYVTNHNDNTVSVIDGSTNRVIGNPIPVGLNPIGIAFDSVNGNLYVTNFGGTGSGDSVSVISGETNQVVGNPIPVGDNPDDITFDSANGNLYVSNLGSSTVSVISGHSNTVIGNLRVLGPAGSSYDSANGNLYVSNTGPSTVTVISGLSNTIVGNPIPVRSYPIRIAYDPAKGNLYVTNYESSTVTAISGETNQVVGNTTNYLNPTPVGKFPLGITYDSANGNLYVANSGSNSVSVISTLSQQPTQTTITSAVDGNNAPIQNGGITTSNSLRFTFITTGGVPPYTYKCILDGASSSCASPSTFANLLSELHQFSIQTTDHNGIQTTTPVFSWTVESTQPPPPPSLTPIQATQQLIQLKHSMRLTVATDQVLDAQLNSAIQSFQNNIKIGGCGHLTGFATQIHTYLQIGRLTQTQASELLQGVQSVEKVAGC